MFGQLDKAVDDFMDVVDQIIENEEKDMDYELHKLRAQLSVLKDVMDEYSGRTIDNVVQNIEARIKAREKRNMTSKKQQ